MKIYTCDGAMNEELRREFLDFLRLSPSKNRQIRFHCCLSNNELLTLGNLNRGGCLKTMERDYQNWSRKSLQMRKKL